MPEFYTIFARENTFCRIWGGGGCPLAPPPVSYAYVCVLTIIVQHAYYSYLSIET